MRFQTLRRLTLALALVTPLSAAHPTDTLRPALAAGTFDASFEGMEVSPAAAIEPGAVDLATIEHTHPEGDESLSGRDIGGGMATYYASKFHGRRTASGERFDMAGFTAAHRTLPFGSKVRVTNAATGRSVVVRINDRGPFHGNRVIDVSRAAAERLGLIAPGSGRVKLSLIEG